MLRATSCARLQVCPWQCTRTPTVLSVYRCRATYFFSCLFRLLDRWQLLWCVACCGAVVFCKTFNLTATFPTGIWVNVLLFPLAFSVNAAYRRREGALALSAEFKATCLSLYLSHRCWQFEESVPHDFLPSSCACFTALFDSVRGYLTAQTEHRKKHELRLLYDIFSELSLVNDVLRISGLPAPLSASLTATLANVISRWIGCGVGEWCRFAKGMNTRDPPTLCPDAGDRFCSAPFFLHFQLLDICFRRPPPPPPRIAADCDCPTNVVRHDVLFSVSDTVCVLRFNQVWHRE